MAIMISGVSHLTFAVSNLDRSLLFYVEWLGCTPIVRWDRGAHLRAGEIWISISLDEAAPEATNNSSYSHQAFYVTPETFDILRRQLLENGVEEWQSNSSPGESFYFLDPDGHKLEIHARSLEDRLEWLRRYPKSDQVWLS